MAVPAIFAAMALGGGIIKAYGEEQAARQEAEAYDEQAQIEAIEAREVISRSVFNRDEAERNAQYFIKQQEAQIGKGGGFGGTATTLLDDTNFKLSLEKQKIKREAEFRANQLIRGAQFKQKTARNIRSGATLRAIGSLLGTAGSTGMSSGAFDRPSKSQKLYG